MSGVNLEAFAWGLLPGEDRKVIAVLFGYFDESGTDDKQGHTVISGFVAPVETWMLVQDPWQREVDRMLKGKPSPRWFHYVDCRGRNKLYHGKGKDECAEHLAILSEILQGAPLQAVSASFTGNIERASALHPDTAFRERFPTAYSLCFEAVVEQITRGPWGREKVALVFARQEEFQPRATEIYDHFKFNGYWPNIIHCGYAEPREVVPLQAADMLAWETRRWLWERGADPEAWRKLPLLGPLIERGDQLMGWAYDEETLVGIRALEPRVFMKRPPAYELPE